LGSYKITDFASKNVVQYELNQTLMIDLLISDSKFNGKEKDEFIVFFKIW